MAFVDLGQYPSRRAISVASVVLVHVALGYAFVNGLAFKVIKDAIPVFQIYDVKEKKPPKEIPKTDPVKKEETKVTIPERVEIKIPTGTERIDFFPPRTPTEVGPDKGPITPLPPELARAVQVKGDRTAWVTTDDYPVEAIRAGQEGRVGITVRVGANGRVTDCQVTSSSSYDALDKAACYYYAKRARFLPAQTADGTAVEASRADWVRWQLPE